MNQFRFVIAILAIALVMRMAVGLWWQERLSEGQQFAMPDSDSYWTLAQTLSQGEPYQYGGVDGQVFRAPGLPLFLAPQMALFGSGRSAVMLVRLGGALLGTLAVALIMIWAGRIWGPSAVLPAGGIAALYPGAIVMSILVLSEMLFCPLMLGNLLLWSAAVEASTTRARCARGLGAGFLAGLATLTRPSWLLFFPGAAVIGWLFFPSRRHQFAVSLWIGLGLVLTMLPWWVRNYQRTGHFVPTTLQVGASLYDGLSPQATGASNMDFTARFYRDLKEEQRAGQLPADVNFEYELDQRLRREAQDWAIENPARVISLMGIKLRRMWNVWPNDAEYRGVLMRWVTLLGYVPTLALGLWGAWRCPRENWSLGLALLPAFYFTVLHVVFVSSMRYREPAMLVLIVLAAGPASYLIEKYGPRRRRAAERVT
jgi:4-amino-4-deoxy-L-arabinose transferase-like glycosyltransferase